MPDLDGELGRLRDRLYESVSQPGFPEVARRSRQRISRRRRQLGAAAVVLLIGAAIPLLRITTEPPSGGGGGAASVAGDAPSGEYVGDIDFVDDTTGYAIRHYCQQNGHCSATLLFTGGFEPWAVNQLPASLRDRSGGLGLQVLGPRRLVVYERAAGAGGKRWYSGDNGRSWQEVPTTVEDSVDTIRPGTVLDDVCDTADCGRTSVVVTLPYSGRLARLTSQPPLDRMVLDRVSAAVDGSWWVSGLVPDAGRWALAVSRDAGRSWSDTELPDHEGEPFAEVRVSVGPDAVYAVGVGRVGPEDEDGLIAIFRSADGGRSWAQTWRADGVRYPRTIGGAAVAAADGSLTVYSAAGVPYASSDGGRSFTPITPAGPTEHAFAPRWTRGGYLAAKGAPLSIAYRQSRDGVSWREFAVQ
ncbi:MAG TPA: hypothetical protein VGX25_12185 [Actinophytocola sp.]|uniref:WD40/YVTN/BNR-like repeat-containing protein n=1 Tax=Actinophytocola sp. TaxID=1872138 RepID=UPI002DDD40F9|nr:hypothetical protein [Actinophytocola sp.]HEV2780142.1 hypothetical protein [Actinophytocola sp.]